VQFNEAISIMKRYDKALFWLVVALGVLGFLTVLSVKPPYGWRQGAFFVCFLVLGVGLARIDYHVLERSAFLIYAGVVILLCGLFFFASPVRGSRSWYVLGNLYFQPVEITKIAVIVVLARLLSQNTKQGALERGVPVGLMVIVAGIPCVLTLLQPDIGSAMTFILILIGMLLASWVDLRALGTLVAFLITSAVMTIFAIAQGQRGVPEWVAWLGRWFSGWPYILGPALVFAGLAGFVWIVAWRLGWHPKKRHFFWPVGVFSLALLVSVSVQYVLPPHLERRVFGFFLPEMDTLGSAYQIIQSKIAVGSGGFIGKGIFGGSQSQLGFLPMAHTDFVFSVLGEELGFLGTAVVLALWWFVFMRCLRIIHESRDAFGSYLVFGICWLFLAQVAMNIGMTLGIMPVVGLPLPFMSYGGSAMLGAMLGFAIIQSVYYHRYTYE